MAIDSQLVYSLAGRHPARRMAFAELLDGLNRAIAAGNIQSNQLGDLTLFGYTSNCQFERRWDIFSLLARGLIIDHRAGRIVATPFPKFFNFGECGLHLPDEPFEVTQKLDGSLGILFCHAGKWRVETRGQLGSEQGIWATQHLRSNVDVSAFDPDSTYLVEIIYAGNRVVVGYPFEGLILLSGYDGSGDEIPRKTIEATADRAGVRSARQIACGSFDELVDTARGLSRDEEGFVVRFAGGHRLKIKGEAYLRVHALVCGCTPLAIWKSMSRCDSLDNVRAELPEEIQRDFDAIRAILTRQFESAVTEIRAGMRAVAHLTDKELGTMLQQSDGGLTPLQRRFAFASRKPGFFDQLLEPGEHRENLFRQLRPDGNVLAGYAASTAISRFADDS